MERQEKQETENLKCNNTEITCWKTIHEAVWRGHNFLVDTVNFQQQRITSVLFTSGLIFAFLGTIAGVFVGSSGIRSVWDRSASSLYMASLFFLALGIAAAIVALWPRIPPSKTSLFLQPKEILNQGEKELNRSPSDATQQLLKELAKSIADDATNAQHIEIIKSRRRWIFVQLVCVFLGLVLLIPALGIKLFMT